MILQKKWICLIAIALMLGATYLIPSVNPLGYIHDCNAQLHWFVTPVDYWINRDGCADIGDDSEFQAVQLGFQAWEDDSASFIDFDYQGTTGYEPTLAMYDIPDGANVIGWIDAPGETPAWCQADPWYPYKLSIERSRHGFQRLVPLEYD